MTEVVSQPPWWRVALGFLIAPLVVLPITVPVLPEYFWDAVLATLGWSYAITGLLCLPAYLFLKRSRRLCVWRTALGGGVIYAAPVIALNVLAVLEGVVLTGTLKRDGDYTDFYISIALIMYALVAGIIGGAIFWLIVYGWRRT